MQVWLSWYDLRFLISNNFYQQHLADHYRATARYAESDNIDNVLFVELQYLQYSAGYFPLTRPDIFANANRAISDVYVGHVQCRYRLGQHFRLAVLLSFPTTLLLAKIGSPQPPFVLGHTIGSIPPGSGVGFFVLQSRDEWDSLNTRRKRTKSASA